MLARMVMLELHADNHASMLPHSSRARVETLFQLMMFNELYAWTNSAFAFSSFVRGLFHDTMIHYCDCAIPDDDPGADTDFYLMLMFNNMPQSSC